MALLLAAGCSWPSARSTALPDYTLVASAEPLAVVVRRDGDTLAATHAPDTAASALYLRTAQGAQYLAQPERFDTTATSLRATYGTTDGRRATLTLTPVAHGGVRLAVSFDPEDGILGVGVWLAARPGEAFHGLTTRVVGHDDDVARDPDVPAALDRRGHHVDLEARGTISLQAPYYLSSRGYGLFVDGTWTGRMNLAEADSERVWIEFDGPDLAMHLFTGGTPARIHEQYVSVVGRPRSFPDWAFGPWRWRNNHVPLDTLFDGTRYRGPVNSMLYEDVAMLEAFDIPMTVYLVDRPWATGSFGYDRPSWDRDRLPHPEGMVRWLDDRDVRLLLWTAPWVMGDAADEALAKGYFLPSDNMVRLGLQRADQAQTLAVLQRIKPGLRAAIDDLGGRSLERAVATFFRGEAPLPDGDAGALRARLRARLDAAETVEALRPLLALPDWGRVLIDFTNPAARTWWQDLFAGVLTDGVAGFKLDRSEEMTGSARDAFAYDGRSMAELRNVYPLLYVEALHEAARRVHGDDQVMMPRAGYPGSQRYGLFWMGDSSNDWLGLRNAVIGGQRASLMGFPFWTHDTGGYASPTFRDVMARWLAFGAFSPIMEVGPTTDRAPWDMPTGPRYDVELIATYRLYSRLRTHLLPYTLRYAEQAHETGAPLVRPLFYAFPDDPRAWQTWDQYLYGDDYLIAPVLEALDRRAVYLPAGEWIDYWNPAVRHTGPTTVTVDVPLHKTPIYLRAGSDEEILDLDALYRESLEIAERRPAPGDGAALYDLPYFSAASPTP